MRGGKGGVWLPLVESLWNDMRWRQRCSEIITRLVLRLSGSEVVLQKGLQVLEGGPLLWVFLPALHHQLMQGRWAVLRARHPVASLHLLQHLAVVHAWRGQHEDMRANISEISTCDNNLTSLSCYICLLYELMHFFFIIADFQVHRNNVMKLQTTKQQKKYMHQSVIKLKFW